MTDDLYYLEIQNYKDRIAELEATLRAAKGYMMNALIDLQTGAPKKTAADTIRGGIAMIDKALGE